MDPLYAGLERQLVLLGKRETAGWKVGLTSGQARDSMGIGFRPFGYIVPDRVFPTGARLPFSAPDAFGIENELCFSFGRDLCDEVDRADVISAITSVAPAFEINEQRVEPGATPQQRLEDNLSQWGIVVGDKRKLDWIDFPFDSVSVDLTLDGELVEPVAARNHIDDHFRSLVALATTLARFDRSIKAGDQVITGSFTRQRVVRTGRWRGDFGSVIGDVEVEFS